MGKQKTVVSIEARMTSSRLPGKVLLKAYDDVSMLEFMVSRIRRCTKIDNIIIATTTNSADDPIIELCNKINVSYHRGSEEDVLQRVLEAHSKLSSDVIVELTGDCPLIDPSLIDRIIDIYNTGLYDYVSNAHIRSYPDGFDVQVFPFAILEEVADRTHDKYDRENVSSYIYRSGKYSLKEVIASPSEYWPDLRVTLDDTGDYLLIKNIIEFLRAEKGEEFFIIDIITYIKNNPKLLELNKDARVSIAPFQKVANKLNEKI